MTYRSTQLQGVTDLTLLAPLKQRFIGGTFDSESHRTRLEKVLAVLNLVRQARESEIQPSPFADSIGRFRAIHFFRFAVVPTVAEVALPPEAGKPRPPPAPSRDQLLLNVTFDGGWEPYMRLIWGPLGTLLDLIFCHCEGYELACKSTFEDYMRWVRGNEVPAQFFYADSAATVADNHYLSALAQRQRAQGASAGIERELAGLALPLTPEPPMATPHAVALAMRVLRSLHRLRVLFPGGSDDADSQGAILLRFAHELLRDLRGWVREGLFDPGAEFAAVRQNGDTDAIAWLMQRLPLLAPGPDAAPGGFRADAVQPGIVAQHTVNGRPVTHGGLWLLRVADLADATRWLQKFVFEPKDDVCRNLAITFSGLQALGVPAHRLALLPQEFAQGMEARAGVLGDVRGNHPRYWQRPHTADGRIVDLRTVHVLLQLRSALRADEKDPADGALLRRLQGQADALLDNSGFEVLHVEPMRSHNPIPAGAAERRGHFGFADGLSQPQVDSGPGAAAHWSDQVASGELFLGHPVAADLQPSHAAGPRRPAAADDLLLNNASFLVVRKLQQHGDRLEAVLDAVADEAPPGQAARFKDDIKARMMGRRQDGQPLVPGMGSGGANDFSYRHDADGLQCPHASHVRRANPREAQRGMPLPRIVRRGMSYGPSNPSGEPDDGKDRGLVFMCYASRIAEQFEVIQRWLTGGNSSGVSSDQSDPFLGVPLPGSARIFACEVDGKLVRVDLGDRALVTLKWGLYALAPAPDALAQWRHIVRAAPPEQGAAAKQPPPADEPTWPLLLDDVNTRRAAWTRIRDQHHGLYDARPYAVLVADPVRVEEVLADQGDRFSVSEYGRRMSASIGEGYLGQDVQRRANRAQFAEAVNKAIEGFSPADRPRALTETRLVTVAVLARLWQRAKTSFPTDPPAIELRELVGGVLGRLCQTWFGLPDAAGKHMALGPGSDDPHAPAQCPGHFLRVSRYVFSASEPSDLVTKLGQAQGQTLGRAVAQWLDAGSPDPGALTTAILAAVGDKEQRATTLAGIMLGFPPTTMGNLIGVLARWIGSGGLWDLQREWLYREDGKARWEWLRGELLRSMVQDSVPYALPRTVAQDHDWHGLKLKKGQMVIIALGAAAAAKGADPRLMFGGARDDERTYAHACPGYELALQVMQGVVAALFEFGSLRPSPVPLTLITPDEPKRPPAAP
jgi:Dyp-type peroxidase family